MKIVIIDGQGGRLGCLLVERVRARLPQARIYALGTNSAATAAMLKAGADFGATGENPVVLYFQDSKKRMGSRCQIHPALLTDLKERLGEENVVVK